MIKTPKVSIITVCRNEVNSIEQTIKSVLEQDYSSIEYIVLDGLSTDGTINIINKYNNQIEIFVSEKDKGIYDAMNKAIDLSKGEILFFLNANDTFFNTHIVSSAISKMNSTGSDLAYGDIMTTGNHKNSGQIIKFNKVNKWFLLQDTICHQAIFTKKELYIKYGKFDLHYRIAADYEWLLRVLIKNKAQTSYLNMIISNYSLDGVSNNPNIRNNILKEYRQISKKYFGTFWSTIKIVYNHIIIIIYKIYSFFRFKNK